MASRRRRQRLPRSHSRAAEGIRLGGAADRTRPQPGLRGRGQSRPGRRTGEIEDVLLLNPDVRLSRGSAASLQRRLRTACRLDSIEGRIGLAAPLCQDSSGAVLPTLRREPTVGPSARGDGAGCASRGEAWLGRGGSRNVGLRPRDHGRLDLRRRLDDLERVPAGVRRMGRVASSSTRRTPTTPCARATRGS